MPGINFEYLLYLIYDFFITLRLMIFDQSLREPIWLWLDKVWWICLIVSLPLLAGIIYFVYKYELMLREQTRRVYGQPTNMLEAVKEGLAVSTPVKNESWEKIQKLISSDNPNDWKFAVLEADKVLEMIVSNFAVPGDNLGEKMKNIERGDFQTLEEAWQAHKVRNRIAHEHNFHLSLRDAQVAIENYKKVFQEFDFI